MFLSMMRLTYSMGRIKTMLIKRVTNQLMDEHGDVFTTEFSKNKALVEEHAEIPSKKIRNVIAGYTTRLKKKQQAIQETL